MKRAAIFTSVFLALMTMQSAKAADTKLPAHKKVRSQQESLIRVVDGPWGEAAPWQIEMLLNAIADEMLQHFPGQRLHPIVVSHAPGGPAVLFQKGPGNEYQVMLSARDENWAEYVYEFSHELVHILANYERHARPEHQRHQWFEEMLCESVSLYMLKHFSLTWNAAPPLPETRGYAPAIQAFTRRALSDRHRKLPAGVSFQQWFSTAAPRLVSSPYMRKENELIASFFLPLVEQNSDWRAVAYLNAGDLSKESSFREFLVHWHRSTPRHLKGFVEESMQVFRFDKPLDLEPAFATGIDAKSTTRTDQDRSLKPL
jgi:hypothetical protein